MNLPKAYIKGFLKAGKSPRLIFILYLSNLVTALLVALPFRDYLTKSFGRSKLFESLLEGFDFTAFSNLMYYNKEGFLTILDSVKWLAVAYFILSVFLSGGIIRILNRDKFSNAEFFSGATFNFFRYLGLSIMFIAVQILFIIAIYLPLGAIIDSLKDKLVSEITFYYWVGGAVLLHMFIFLLVSMISDYSKFYLEINDSFNIFKGFWKGIKYVFTHFFKTYFLYLFLLFLPGVVMYLYLYLEKDIKMALGVGILTVFAMQQAFILLRMFLRVWILASEFKMYEDDTNKNNEDNDDAIANSYNEKPLKKVKKIKKKEKVVKAPVPVVEEQVIEEEKVSEATEQETEKDDVKKDDASDYAIDFDKAFSDNNEIDADETSLTEDEVIKQSNFEDRQKQWLKDKEEDKITRQEEEVYDEEEYEEPAENEISSFDEDDTEEDADSDVSADTMIEQEEEFDAEKVRQNVMHGILQSQIGVDEDEEDENDNK